MTGFADPRGSQTVLRFLPPGPSLQKSHLTEFATMETGPDNVCIFTAPVAKSWLNSATTDASPISKSVPEFQMLHLESATNSTSCVPWNECKNETIRTSKNFERTYTALTIHAESALSKKWLEPNGQWGSRAKVIASEQGPHCILAV